MLDYKLNEIRKKYLPSSLSEGMVFLLVIIFYALRDIPVLLYGGQVLAFGMILWIKRGVRKRYTLSWLLFICFAALSGIWATNTTHYVKFIREISQGALLCVLFYACCDSEEKIEKTLRMIAAAALVMMVYFVIKTPWSEWSRAFHSTEAVSSSYDRFGRTIGYHPNSFGMLCAIELGCWLYQWRKTGKWTQLIWCAALLVLLLFSKSRTAFLFIGMLGVIYLLLEKRNCRKVVGRILLVGGLILAAFWLVMNIEPLYKLVGYRLTGAVSFLTNDGNVDASVRERNKMISAGLDMFIKHPLLGVGARNYSNIAFAKYGIWADVYAHSNLIEILADFGLIGTLLYYIPRIWCLVRLFRLRKRITDPQRLKCCAFLTAFVITNLITDYIYISFNNEAIQLVYTLCFAFACFGGETAEERRAPVIPLKTWEGRKKHEQKVFPAGAAG